MLAEHEPSPHMLNLRLCSTAETEAVQAHGATKRIKSDHLHQEITPAMTAHPFGST